MQSYYTTIPTYITTRDDLLDGEKIFYGVIQSLCCKYGFCWASNETLAKISHKTPRHVQRYLQKLKGLGLLIVEIEHRNERKIWTRETWHNREQLKKSFNQDFEFNQRFTRYDMDVVGGTTWMSHNYDNEINTYKKKVGKERGVGKTNLDNQPRQASAPTSFLNKKTQKQRPQPPPIKPPIKPTPDTEKIYSLSKIETQLLDKLIVDSKERSKYINNAIKFLAKKHHNAYKNLSLFEVVKMFWSEDQEKKCENKTARKEKACEEGRKFIEEVKKLNPKSTSEFEIEKDYVVVSRSPTCGDITINLDDQQLYEKIEERLKMRQCWENIGYTMPGNNQCYQIDQMVPKSP